MGKCVSWVKQGLGYVPWAGWQFGCALVIDEGPVINEPRLLRGEFDNRMCGAFFMGAAFENIMRRASRRELRCEA